jgi:hypothetical protein
MAMGAPLPPTTSTTGSEKKSRSNQGTGDDLCQKNVFGLCMTNVKYNVN